jgi:hypothetical protein
MAELHFPVWAFITEMIAFPVAFTFFGLLVRRLRRVHPTIWEKLGQPTLFIWTWPGSIIALLERTDANLRLAMFPFRRQSFQLGDPATAVLLWFLRATLGLIIVLRLWSWWANS